MGMESTPNVSIDELLAHAGWVRDLAAALMSDPSSADDLVQDTWVAAMRQPPSASVSARPWLARVMRNLAQDRWRAESRRSRREAVVARPEALAAEREPVAEFEMHRTLVEALAQIEEPQRATIIRRYFQGLSASDIASIDHISLRTVQDRIRRGLDLLRARLDRRYGDRSTWATLLAPIALRSVATNAGAATPIGVAALSPMSKAVGALAIVLVVGVVGLWAWRPSSPREPLTTVASLHEPSLASDAKRLNGVSAPAELPVARRPVALPPVTASSPDQPPKSIPAAVAVPHDAPLTVRVVSKSTGDPVPGARVALMGTDPHKGSMSAVFVNSTRGNVNTAPYADANGIAQFDVPAGMDFRLHVHAGENRSSTQDLDVAALNSGEHRDIVVRLITTDDLHFCARVISSEENAPVVAARYRVTQELNHSDNGETRHDSTTIAEGITDADGRFELQLASWKQLQVWIEADGFGPCLGVVASGHETPADALVVALGKTASLRATVVGAAGLGFDRLTVRLSVSADELVFAAGRANGGGLNIVDSPHLATQPDLEWKATTGHGWQCELTGLPSGVPLRAELQRDGHPLHKEPGPVLLRPGEVREITLNLGSGTELHGRLIDQDKMAIPNAEIWIEPAAWHGSTWFARYSSSEQRRVATTDSAGDFVFKDLAAGSWWIGPANHSKPHDRPRASAIAPVAIVVDVLAGTKEQTVDLHVHRGLYIQGRVVDPDRKPMQNTAVYGMSSTITWPSFFQTDADGKFALGPLVPGNYQIWALGTGLFAAPEPLDVQAGEHDIVIQLRVGAILNGVVVDAGTGEPCSAEVAFSRRAAAPRLLSYALAEADGTFKCEGLDIDRYDLVASTRDGRVGTLLDVAVAAGKNQGRLTLTVRRGAKLALRYDGKRGPAHARILSDGVPVAETVLIVGTSTSQSVPPGHLTVQLAIGGQDNAKTRELDLAIGEEKEIVFADD
jgi:RNA polymerase sigma factor (sigma-70 family)